jgi:uncharacterized membrane protein YsdA (DUF1294 family)
MSPRTRLLPALLCAALAFPTLAVYAADKNPADYPLRLHIFTREEHTHYRRGVEDFSVGDGRADLFANGEAHAVDFHFNCNEKIESSLGFETYMAKWRKPGKQLTVLFPVFGQSGKFFACDIDTDVKPDVAYFKQKGNLNTEPVAVFKAWMQKHNYDPEHSKNTPSNPEAEK